ncbi:MAG: helix-turn-helix domain-containing protein [Chthoniobacteraceae bacterium]
MPRAKKSKIALAIGNQIRAQRKAIGISQERFAELSGLSKNYIGNLERGEYEVSVATLDQIGRSLGTSASLLLKNAGL